ncbi:methyltransferase [Entomomonas asaccharolytica]|uniref:Methyltransferase n=1 Tax=Entomomonas asaccharolytica TaxID=2785331 RepID=A0A974NEH3_9GAMM|nr:methyltransferase [Entomomonas asaccharolytica]QQP85150.1 methyltransferase [Entomomonas asaccharolytica]
MSKVLTTPFARLKLDRYPTDSHPSLQAFDAADEYLLNELATINPAKGSSILILNDSFGSLACSLVNQLSISSCGDSYLAERALYNNLAENNIPLSTINFIPSTELLLGQFDVVLIKIPKTLALLEEQLIQLQPHITADTLILAGAMIKHLSKTASELIEKYIGSVQASLAVKKARLLRVTPTHKKLAKSPYPSYYKVEELNLTLVNHANVFCREGLDIGSRVLMPYLTYQPNFINVADLGCGNGILGIIFALNNPQAEIILVDESYMAIASAKANWQQALPKRSVTIKVADGLLHQANNSLDCILCNPPFHQQQVIGDFIAKRMFKQARDCLKQQGELWIVANRHLNYYQLLKKLFRQVTTITQTNKFVVLKATK